MRKDTTLIVFGVLTALIPFMGIPTSWKMVTTVVLGILVTVVALSLRQYLSRVSERLRSRKTESPVYIENEDKSPQPIPKSIRRRVRQTV